jgi:hypothetical protein
MEEVHQSYCGQGHGEILSNPWRMGELLVARCEKLVESHSRPHDRDRFFTNSVCGTRKIKGGSDNKNGSCGGQRRVL